tara:strand:- start:2739 stop:3233 length:495 start_codon:yes stop_codon:yes gene_type:complete
MQANDFLLKKWCFGTGRSKARDEATVNTNGELQTYRTYPKYRTIVFKVEKATKKGKQWTVEGKQYSSLNGMPKQTTLNLLEKNGAYYVPKQKRPFLRIQNPGLITEDGLPPVGSLITVNKKHAIVTAVGRNELTVFVNNKLQTITCRPGTIKWHSDKILAGAVK